MTTVAAKHCSLCHCTLPTDTTKRRRLHGISSSLALQVFLDVSSQAGLKNVVPLEDHGPRNGPFLCLKCHSQLDKTAKLKANLAHLTTDIERKVKETAATLNIAVTPSTSGITETIANIKFNNTKFPLVLLFMN